MRYGKQQKLHFLVHGFGKGVSIFYGSQKLMLNVHVKAVTNLHLPYFSAYHIIISHQKNFIVDFSTA